MEKLFTASELAYMERADAVISNYDHLEVGRNSLVPLLTVSSF